MKSLEKELEYLLDLMINEWGYCSISTEDYQRIAKSERLDADEFARQILRADGCDPESELRLRRVLKKRFVEHFGTSAVSRVEFDDGVSSDMATDPRTTVTRINQDFIRLPIAGNGYESGAIL